VADSGEGSAATGAAKNAKGAEEQLKPDDLGGGTVWSIIMAGMMIGVMIGMAIVFLRKRPGKPEGGPGQDDERGSSGGH
jgi:hypothetical protein